MYFADCSWANNYSLKQCDFDVYHGLSLYISDCLGEDKQFLKTEGSTIISQCMCSRPAGSFRKQTWSTINELHVEQCPDILSVIDLVLTLLAHSADCERGFSHSKLVKSDWRSKLQDTAVTDSLTVVLQTPSELDFNPEDAVRHWNGKSTRRPNQTCGGSDSESDSYLATALARLGE